MSDLFDDALNAALERARQRTRMQKIRESWPERHLVGKGGNPVPFHMAQNLVWDSERRIIAYISGSQGGKTSLAPWFLDREIRRHGSGDYLAVTSSFDLFRLKFLPSLLLVFEEILKIGRYWAGDKVLEIADPDTGKFLATKSTDAMWARIVLRSAQSLGGLESATAIGAVLDEVGQDEFTVEAYRAIRRRLVLNKGRLLLTSTLYNLG